jgi:predicted ATPase
VAIHQLTVAGYRSIRTLGLKLAAVNVLTGPNGCGKSNLYNSIFLLSKAAAGGFARAIADEGGMPSVLYAGREKVRYTRRKPPVRVILSITGDDYQYELQFGLPESGPPVVNPSQFMLDPKIKEESVRLADSRVTLMNRDRGTAHIRDADGRMVTYPLALLDSESVLSQIQEPHVYPELSALRMEMLRWRFYHGFRTDPHSPLRSPQVGVMTPVLSHDGADLAAAVQTIVEIGDEDGLREAVDRAFPGARLEVRNEHTRFSLLFHMPGVLRALSAPELSDGTLRYLCLVAALLSPRPPALLALNEPETSIHPDLIAPLAQLIANASRRAQLWITTHSRALAGSIEQFSGQVPIELRMDDGETVIASASSHR